MQGLIYNQRDIPKKELRYGFRSSAATGCGWIAVHNALLLMGLASNPKELIRRFERSFPIVNGNFGTFLPDLVRFFKKQGFEVKLRFLKSRFDLLVESSEVCIMFYFWYYKRAVGSHFVTLHKKDGRVLGYNTYKNSVGADDYGKSLEEYIKKHKFYLPVLIGINQGRGK